MADSLQANAKIQLDTPLGPDVLLATGILGQEEISRPYVFTLTLLSRNFNIAPDDVLGKIVGIRIKRENQDEYRGFSGFVAAFSGGELHPKRREWRTYSMRVVPWLSLLDQGAKYRIFQDKDVLQVIDAVLTDAIQGMFGAGASPSLYYQIRVRSSPRYPALQFCVQYGETDLSFVSRLMEQHGIYYFFEQSDTNHSMIMIDTPGYKVAEESPISFFRSPDSRGGVINWTHSWAPRLRRWTVRDREYRLNPPVTEKSEDTIVPEIARATQGDHYEFAGGFAVLTMPGQESQYASMLARTRVEEEEARFDVFSGNTVRVTFSPGLMIRLIGVNEQPQAERIPSEEEKRYLITSVSFSATEGAITDDRPGEIINKLIHDAVLGGVSRGADRLDDAQKNNLPEVNKVIANLPGVTNVLSAFGVGFLGPWVGLLLDWASPVLTQIPIIGPFIARKPPDPRPYTNSFNAVPIVEGRPFRARSLTPKPRVRGPQTAFVWGTTDHDVATDELGRVKVKFDWDRTQPGSSPPETNSCFLRVVQGWAGPKRGMQFLPRVDDEVLVDFIDGDPDRPIITGRVYNAVQKPPFDLTTYRLHSGIKTRSFPLAEGAKDQFHLLRFDDTAGQEQTLLRSQGRLDVTAFGTHYDTAHGDRHVRIGGKDPKTGKSGGSFFVTLGGEHDLHVDKARYEAVDKDDQLTVKGEKVVSVTGKVTEVSSNAWNISAPKIAIEASVKISLKVGSSFVVLDPAGVYITGPMVNINSGGAADTVANADMLDVADAAAADPGDPQDWRAQHRGGGGGPRGHHTAAASHGLNVTRNPDGSFQVTTGVRVKGTPAYVSQVVEDLATISNTKDGRARLDRIDASGRQVTIQNYDAAHPKPASPNAETEPGTGTQTDWANASAPGTQVRDTAGNLYATGNGTGNDSNIRYDPNDWPDPTSRTKAPSDVVLNHELGHADNQTNGKTDMTPNANDSYGNNEEFNNLSNDNSYRRERNPDPSFQRRDYGDY